MKRFLGLLAALLFAAAPAFAAPVPYVNTPLDTPQAMINTALQGVNAAFPTTQSTVSCTGTTTATCNGTRIAVSITGLTTAAAGVLSAQVTVTDSSVTASSQIVCFVNGYAGTGVPVSALPVAGAGSFTFYVQNTANAAALNATVVNTCLIYN